jgi:hypothetical protein
LETDEKQRISAQVKRLGKEGLKKAQEELDEAKAENDKPIPTEILTKFHIPNVSSISWIPVQSVQQKGKGRSVNGVSSKFAVPSTALTERINADGTELPFFVQYDHVEVCEFSFRVFCFSLNRPCSLIS